MIEVNGWNEQETKTRAKSLFIYWMRDDTFDPTSDKHIKDRIPYEFSHIQLQVWFMRAVNNLRTIMVSLASTGCIKSGAKLREELRKA